MFISRKTKLNDEIFLKRYGTSLTREKKIYLSTQKLLVILSGQCSYPPCLLQAIRIAHPRRNSSHCSGTSTDVERNLNGALCKEWCEEDHCPTSCCCSVLPSTISVAQTFLATSQTPLFVSGASSLWSWHSGQFKTTKPTPHPDFAGVM